MIPYKTDTDISSYIIFPRFLIPVSYTHLDVYKRQGLSDTKRILSSRPYQLSGGMLQRCLIALAIAGNAKLVVADEPTTALDAIHRDKAVEQFLHLQEQGCALLLVTHDFDVARHVGGHVLILKEGQMVEQGCAQEVLQNPIADYTKELIEAIHLGWG